MPPGNRITTFIDANPEGLRRGLQQANSQLNGFARTIKSVVGPALAGLGAGAAIRGLDNLARSAIRAGDEIDKASRTAGIGAEKLQELRFAAELAGTSHKQLDDAVGRFTRRLGEARRGNTEYSKTFEQLGVTARDTQERALDKVFRSLGQIEDITVRTSLATKVFGDDARRMALLVEGGADAIDRAAQNARDLGIILSNEAVAALTEANDELTRLSGQLETRVNEAVAENIDLFIRWQTAITGAKTGLIGFADAFDDFLLKGAQISVLEAQLRPLEKFAEKTPAVVAEIERLQRAIASLRAGQDDTPFFTLEGVNSALRGASQGGAGAGETAPFDFAGKIPGLPTLKSDAFARNFEYNLEAMRSAVERFQTPLEKAREELKKLQALQPFAESIGEGEQFNETLNRAHQQISELIERENAAADAARQFTDTLSAGFAAAALAGKDFGNVLQGLIKQLAFQGLFDILSTALGGGGFSLGNAFGGALSKLPGLAAGGPVFPGRAFIVGERGPELFVPGERGSIVPNGASIGGRMSVVQNLHFDVTLQSVREQIATMTPQIAAAVYDALDQARNRPDFV
jgi:hypothetical protein